MNGAATLSAVRTGLCARLCALRGFCCSWAPLCVSSAARQLADPQVAGWRRRDQQPLRRRAPPTLSSLVPVWLALLQLATWPNKDCKSSCWRRGAASAGGEQVVLLASFPPFTCPKDVRADNTVYCPGSRPVPQPASLCPQSRRTWTRELPAGGGKTVKVEMGAAWVHGLVNNPIVPLAKQAGVSLAAEITDYENNVLYLSDGREASGAQETRWAHGWGRAVCPSLKL